MNNINKRTISEKQIKLRKKLWPELDESKLWVSKGNKKIGYITIPRTMPIIMKIMDSLSKNKPISSVFLELWCRTFDERMVTLNRHHEYAFHSGFSGQRAVQTWKERINILFDLGFIDLKPGPSGEISYALVFNPYHVIRDHYERKTPGIVESMYNALLERANEIKATDLDDDNQENECGLEK